MQRFYSLDVFRGATVALMILVNNPGSWNYIYPPLEHAEWNGCTPTDLVFPFFLFAVGNAMAFVLPKLQAAGSYIFWRKILKRSLLIFIIGLLLNWFPFIKWVNDHIEGKPWINVRILGVLQRIAICYFFASIISYFFKPKGIIIVSIFLLILYWILCITGNYNDPFSLTGWFGTAIDTKILGATHMYKGEGIPFDPEGIMNSWAAIVQVLFGYLAGTYIVKGGKNPSMLNGLFVTGCLLVLVGICWDVLFPINKKIWTSSYTIYTTGLALLILSILIYIIEFKNWKGAWSRFFDVFGKNALFIFVLSGALPRLLNLIRIPVIANGHTDYTSPLGWFYKNICKPILPAKPEIGSLVYAICFILLMWFIAWLLNRKKIYIKV